MRAARADMLGLDGGRFLMGTEDTDGFPADGEGPVREVELSPFSIDSSTGSLGFRCARDPTPGHEQ